MQSQQRYKRDTNGHHLSYRKDCPLRLALPLLLFSAITSYNLRPGEVCMPEFTKPGDACWASSCVDRSQYDHHDKAQAFLVSMCAMFLCSSSSRLELGTQMEGRTLFYWVQTSNAYCTYGLGLGPKFKYKGSLIHPCIIRPCAKGLTV